MVAIIYLYLFFQVLKMDQDVGNRRRSSRLAARGVVVTPKADASLKKIAKSSEKPKRAKRKTTEEEVIELSDAKKTKTEDKTSDEVDNPKEKQTNSVKKNDVSAIKSDGSTSIDVDNVEEVDVELNDKTGVKKETETLLEDSKGQGVSEKNISDVNDEIELVTDNDEENVTLVTNDGEGEEKTGDEAEKVKKDENSGDEEKIMSKTDNNEEKITSETDNDEEKVTLTADSNEEKFEELEEKADDKGELLLPSINDEKVELLTNNETEKVSPATENEEEKISLTTDNEEQSVVSDKPKEEVVALEIVNGNDGIKETETDEPVEEIVKNNIEFSVTTKNVGKPNGDAIDQVKSTNGNKSDTQLEEQKKVLSNNTNYVETDLKAALTTANVAITPNNDASSIEQGKKETIKDIDNAVDNTNMSDGDNTPKTVDQSPTVVS